ncbi:MAG: ABC transporter substrate-binding protein [Chloroflexota bacterium]|nr:ABC transporter substrate-binding protein [Chloroflexota bacterium]MDE2960328.1 ABC transporter substrate-binding protein [Chloroflexota bacterium]
MKTRRILIPVFGFVAAAALAVAGGWFALGNVVDAQTDLAAPANVRAVQGPGMGEAIVSWDAVDGATGYVVQWVDLDAAWAAYDAGQNWTGLIRSKPVEASEDDRESETIGNLLADPARGYAFRVRSRQDGVTSAPSEWDIIRLPVEVDAEAAVEVLAAALAISRHASALVAEPLPTSEADFPGYRAMITALDQQVEALSGKGHAARVQQIETLVNRLKANTNLILRDRPALLRAVVAETRSRETLTQTNRDTLFPAAAASVDNQFYHVMTNVGDGTALSDEDILRYSHMDSLGTNVTLGHTLLLVASLMQDPTFVARIQESYDGVNSRIVRDIEYLADHGGPNLGRQVIPLARQFVAAGSGDQNYFDRLASRLELVAQENARIATNEKILDQLLHEIDRLAAAAQAMPDPGPLPPEDPVSPGFTDTEVKFGQSAALDGPAKALGQGMMMGVDAAFKEANADGGVHGRTLNLITKDDRYETDPAFDNTQDLIEKDQVFALIGAVGTPTSRAALPLAEDAEVPFIAPFTGAQLLRGDELTQVLNFRASYYEETEKMIDLLAAAGKTRVAVLYQNDSYGNDGLTGVKNALASRGMEPVASWYYRRNTEAINSAAFRISEANPDAVIIIGGPKPSARIIEKLRMKMEPDPTFLAVSFVGSDALAQELGSDGAGVYVTQVVPLPTDTSSMVVANYRSALTAYYPQETPGFISLEGYIAGRLAIERLEACGVNLSR